MTHSRCAWKRLCFPCVMTPENSTRPCAEPLRTSSQLPASMPTTESRPGGATGVAGPAGGSAGVATRSYRRRCRDGSSRCSVTRSVSDQTGLESCPGACHGQYQSHERNDENRPRARTRAIGSRGLDDGMVVSNGAAASVRSARISSRAGRAGAHSGAATEKEAVGVTCDATLGPAAAVRQARPDARPALEPISNHAPARPASCQPNVAGSCGSVRRTQHAERQHPVDRRPSPTEGLRGGDRRLIRRTNGVEGRTDVATPPNDGADLDGDRGRFVAAGRCDLRRVGRDGRHVTSSVTSRNAAQGRATRN